MWPNQCCFSSKGDYGGYSGGRRDEERSRHSDGGGELEGQKRAGATSGNAWSKGKPSSLGGPQKPIILKRKAAEEETPVS